MARGSIPDPLKRRHELERQLDPARALRTAQAYLDAGRLQEAVAFLRKAEARERLEAIREKAIAAGDVFLLREVSAALGGSPNAAHWRAAAQAAAAAGKERYAEEASRQAERLES